MPVEIKLIAIDALDVLRNVWIYLSVAEKPHFIKSYLPE